MKGHCIIDNKYIGTVELVAKSKDDPDDEYFLISTPGHCLWYNKNDPGVKFPLFGIVFLSGSKEFEN